MRTIVLTYGLIAGAILSAMMLATLPFMDRIGYDNGMLIGYTTMVVAFMMIFYGIRAYRDNLGGGAITYRRGFQTGLLITAIASLCYVLTWQVIYYTVAPDYADKMAAHMIEKQRAAGATDAELEAARAEMERFRELYRNPLFNAGITLLEVFPVGLIVTAISAGILRRREPLLQPA